MKFSISRLGIIALATTLGIVINSRSANAASFAFSQTGWQNGGIVTGKFSGQDTNGDDIISFKIGGVITGEVSDYQMTFSGNTTPIPSFSHELINLVALTYNLSTGVVTDIISSTLPSGFAYDANLNSGSIIGQINNVNGSLTTTTSSAVQVTNILNIPEGNSLMGLMAVTLMGGLTLGRRSQRTND